MILSTVFYGRRIHNDQIMLEMVVLSAAGLRACLHGSERSPSLSHFPTPPRVRVLCISRLFCWQFQGDSGAHNATWRRIQGDIIARPEAHLAN